MRADSWYEIVVEAFKIESCRLNRKRVSAFLKRRSVWLWQQFRTVVHAFESGTSRGA
jgi:hypothetical protein